MNGWPDALVRLGSLTAAVVGVSVVIVTGALVASPGLRDAAGITHSKSGYRVGQEFDVRDARLATADRTAVLFLRGTCSACQIAVPALRTFVDSVSHRANAQVVLVTPRSPPDAELDLALSLGLQPNQVIPVDLRRLRLREVPTLVVVDRGHRILFVAAGIPSENDLKTAVQILTSP